MDKGYLNLKWEREGDYIFSRPSYIKDMEFSRPSHNTGILIPLHTKNCIFGTLTYKKWQFHDPHIQKVPFSRPPPTKDYAHALNKDQQKIEAMQNTVCILEIQINTKAIQNCKEMKK